MLRFERIPHVCLTRIESNRIQGASRGKPKITVATRTSTDEDCAAADAMMRLLLEEEEQVTHDFPFFRFLTIV